MLAVNYAGPRSFPCISVREKTFLMEHKVFAAVASSPDLEHTSPEDAIDRYEDFLARTGLPVRPLLPIEEAPFWLFGFDQQQVECIYQGPCPLSDVHLARILPALRQAVRDELDTGLPQHRSLE